MFLSTCIVQKVCVCAMDFVSAGKNTLSLLLLSWNLVFFHNNRVARLNKTLHLCRICIAVVNCAVVGLSIFYFPILTCSLIGLFCNCELRWQCWVWFTPLFQCAAWSFCSCDCSVVALSVFFSCSSDSSKSIQWHKKFFKTLILNVNPCLLAWIFNA